MIKKLSASLLMITFLVFPVLSVSAFSLNSYHVGNSLTWDARVSGGLPQLSADAGFNHTTGWHIKCGQSLSYIATHPTETCVNPNSFGTFEPALANFPWDVISLQVFSGTPEQEYLAFESIVSDVILQNQDNSDSRVYLYQSWPLRPTGETFVEKWLNDSLFNPQTDSFVRIKSQFDWIYDQLKSDPDLADVDIRVIPAGDVLAEVETRMIAGTIPTHDLYRDAYHLTNLGRFIAANTYFAVLFNQAPFGLSASWHFNTNQPVPIEITDELALLVQDAVWDVVSEHPQSGVLKGDLNLDGFVGIEDLNIVLTNWNSTDPLDPMADPTGDDFVGIEDLNVVLSNWNAGTVSAPLQVEAITEVQDEELVESSTAPEVKSLSEKKKARELKKLERKKARELKKLERKKARELKKLERKKANTS